MGAAAGRDITPIGLSRAAGQTVCFEGTICSMPRRSAYGYSSGRPAQLHLAIVDRVTAQRLLSGQKRIESRFSKSRRAPFGRVVRGDILLFKLSGGQTLGMSEAMLVKEYDRLDRDALDRIRRRHGKWICAPEAYWRARRFCRYGTLIWLGPLRPPPESFRPPRQYGNGWVVLGGLRRFTRALAVPAVRCPAGRRRFPYHVRDAVNAG